MSSAKLFSEMLLLEASGNYTTSEQIHKAIVKFDDLPKSQQPAEAKKILKSAEKINYLVRAEKILKYKNVKVDSQKEKKDTKPKETKVNNDLPKTQLDWSESKKFLKDKLSQKFPDIKFSFNKSGYDTLYISYTDGNVAENEVVEFVRKYKGKSFDGIDDSTSYINNNLAFGYIMPNRTITEDKYKKIYNDYVKNREISGVKFDMDYEEFTKLGYFNNDKYKNINGNDPMNMLFRLINNLETSDKKLPNYTKSEKKESLFDLTRTDKIEKMKGESVDQKEASKIIKKHISQRFPFAKFSVSSDGNAIRISLKSSPFTEDSKYNKSIMEYVEQYANSLNHKYNLYIFTSKWGMVKTEDNKELQSQFDVSEKENDEKNEIEYRKRVAEQEKQRELDKIAYDKQKVIDDKNKKSIEDNAKVVDVDDPYFVYKVKFSKLNKNQTIGEYENEVNSGEYNTRKVKVEREVNFDNKEDFDNFSNMLLHDFSFLENQGGTYSDDPRFADFDSLSKVEKSTIDFYDVGVMIKYKNKDMYFVDPQGFPYARYVGLLQDGHVQQKKHKPSKEEVKSKVDELSEDELEKLMELMKQLKK